jgi:hypothetical protein
MKKAMKTRKTRAKATWEGEAELAMKALLCAAEEAYQDKIVDTYMFRHVIGPGLAFASKEDWLRQKVEGWLTDARFSLGLGFPASPGCLQVHQEPDEFKSWPAEHCVLCKKPTRTWLTPHVPLCGECSKDPDKVKFAKGEFALDSLQKGGVVSLPKKPLSSSRRKGK